MIRADHLTRRFGRVVAVDDVSFTVARGESVALWGSNGAGKTTVLRCLLGLLPFGGTVTLDGVDVRRRGRDARRRVGFVPQDVRFHAGLTVGDVLAFFARLRRADRAQVGRWLERTQLADARDRAVGALSGGMRQKLALAVAMLSEPPLLMLDEPTANLDARARAEFVELLQDLRGRGHTLLFCSHRNEEVSALADRVLGLEAGRLVRDQSVDAWRREGRARARLYLRLDPARMDAALSTLSAAGFRASRNGAGIRVHVPEDEKARPVAALVRAGFEVDDFVVEDADASGEETP